MAFSLDGIINSYIRTRRPRWPDKRSASNPPARQTTRRSTSRPGAHGHDDSAAGSNGGSTCAGISRADPHPAAVVNMGEAPPAPEPPYMANLESVSRNLPQPNLSNATVDAEGQPVGATYGTPGVAVPPPRRTEPVGQPEIPGAGPVPLTAPHVFMGERTIGMSPADAAAAHVKALQEADPSSKVTRTAEGFEIAPPNKMSRLKAAGKMFLERMRAGAPFGIGGMVGAGVEGAVEGGIAPGHAQKQLRAGELARAQNDQYQAQQLEHGQLTNEAEAQRNEAQRQSAVTEPQRRKDAEYEKERTDLEQMVGQSEKVAANTPEHAAALEAIQKEADRLSQKYGRQVTVIPGRWTPADPPERWRRRGGVWAGR